jgi:hypothetical protein
MMVLYQPCRDPEHAEVGSANAARQSVYALAEKGLICRTNPGVSGKGTKAIYTLAGEGEDEDVIRSFAV